MYLVNEAHNNYDLNTIQKSDLFNEQFNEIAEGERSFGQTGCNTLEDSQAGHRKGSFTSEDN